MTDRDRLIELFSPFADGTYNGSGTIIDGTKVDDVADHLLANGVIVAPMPMADWLKQELTEHVHKRCMEEL